MSILIETQNQRDKELSELTNTDIKIIKNIEIASPDTLRIYDNDKIETESDYNNLYKDFKHLNTIGYIKTLMYTSIYRRGNTIKDVIEDTKNKICLDFGSGVGTHAIALLENENNVDMLDVNGPLLNFAKDRIKKRGHNANVIDYNSKLQPDHYDVIICMDVLEHVYNPLKKFLEIYATLKTGGKLVLQVSGMIKMSSGHFKRSIDIWKTKCIPLLGNLFINKKEHLYIKGKI